MQLKLYKTLWGHNGDIDSAIEECIDAGFDGIEGPTPVDDDQRRDLRRRIHGAGLEYIAEICTAGSYVPDRNATVDDHLDSLRGSLIHAAECLPRFATVIAGCDAWSVDESADFFGRAQEIADSLGIIASFETHRGRSMFNPWTTRDILRKLDPRNVRSTINLTCDFSHWCVVCERLIDTELDIVEMCAERAMHIHARVGYDQGPQVPDPSASEYLYAVEAHERWWKLIWESRLRRGEAVVTMTPEFGPDGYLHHMPHTLTPVADLWTVNRWMGERLRSTFAEWIGEDAPATKTSDLRRAATPV